MFESNSKKFTKKKSTAEHRSSQNATTNCGVLHFSYPAFYCDLQVRKQAENQKTRQFYCGKKLSKIIQIVAMKYYFTQETFNSQYTSDQVKPSVFRIPDLKERL